MNIHTPFNEIGSSPKVIVNRNSGFALPGAIFVLLIFICLGFVFFGSTKLQLEDGRLLHFCRVQMLKAQNFAVQTIDDLIKLNKTVLQLRTQLKIAQAQAAAAAASGNTPLLLDAKRRILAIKAKQVAISSKQKVLLLKGKLSMSLEINQMFSVISGINSSNSIGHHSVTNLKLPEAKIAVSPAEFGLDPPTYKINLPLEQTQYLQVEWLSSFVQNDLGGSKWLPKRTSHTIGCAATVKDSGKEMIAHLTRVKSLSNQLFF